MNTACTTAARSVHGRMRAERGRMMGLAIVMGLALSGLTATETLADSVETWNMEFGTRYWYSTGEARKDLYDDTGTLLISRLTYDDIDAHSGEAYFRLDHVNSRFFIKGYAGLGGIVSGNLRDEDFEPLTVPYSSTDSEQEDGWLGYASIDFGFRFMDTGIDGGPRLRLGAFGGYHYYHEKLNAYGCQQTATNAYICTPSLSTSLKVITQDNDWHSLRLGMVADVQASDRLRLTLDAAYTYSWLDGKDHHWLRPSINPVPEDGDGHGFQLEGVLAYQVTEGVEIGIGGRYWQFGRFDTKAHFEDTPGGGFTQQEKWKSTRYGVFLQASWRF